MLSFSLWFSLFALFFSLLLDQRRGWVLAAVVVLLCCCSAGATSSPLTEEEATAAAQAELAGKTHYEVLGVGPDATLPELKRAFRALTLELHPDKLPKQAGPAERAAAQVRFLRVVEAFETLKDPQRRAWYNFQEQATSFGFHWHADGARPMKPTEPYTLTGKLAATAILFVIAVFITLGWYLHICLVYGIYAVLFHFRYLWKYALFVIFALLLRSSGIFGSI